MLTGKTKQCHAFAPSHGILGTLGMRPPKDSRVTANLRQDTEAWYPLLDDTSTVVRHCERIGTYLQPIEPRSSHKMSRSFLLDYLLLLLAPLIASLFSKIQMSAPRSKYVVVHNASAAPADLIISTKYLEIHASHSLTVALLISLSVLSVLHLVYFIYVVWQPLQPVNLPWRTEFEAYGNPEDEGALARSKTNVELNEMTIPVSAVVRGETSLRSKSATYEGQHRPEGEEEDESDDWKTIYCEKWLDGLDSDCVTGVELHSAELVEASED